MSSNVALYGMMGAGKSTVGRQLADRLGRAFADSDEEVVTWRGVDIPTIFATEGEPAFRAYESTVIRELATYHDLVIALGGGAVLSDDNVADLALTSVFVELRVSPDVAAARLAHATQAQGRPLLAGDVDERVRAVHAERAERYARVADVVIDADGAVEAVLDDLLGWLVEHRDVLTPSEFEAVMT